MDSRHLSTIADDAKRRDDLETWRWALRGNYWYTQMMAAETHRTAVMSALARCGPALSSTRGGRDEEDEDEEKEEEGVEEAPGAGGAGGAGGADAPASEAFMSQPTEPELTLL